MTLTITLQAHFVYNFALYVVWGENMGYLPYQSVQANNLSCKSDRAGISKFLGVKKPDLIYRVEFTFGQTRTFYPL